MQRELEIHFPEKSGHPVIADFRSIFQVLDYFNGILSFSDCFRGILYMLATTLVGSSRPLLIFVTLYTQAIIYEGPSKVDDCLRGNLHVIGGSYENEFL